MPLGVQRRNNTRSLHENLSFRSCCHVPCDTGCIGCNSKNKSNWGEHIELHTKFKASPDVRCHGRWPGRRRHAEDQLCVTSRREALLLHQLRMGRCVPGSGCAVRRVTPEWPWNRAWATGLALATVAGCALPWRIHEHLDFLHFCLPYLQNILGNLLIRYLKAVISGVYFCIWEDWFFPSLSLMEQKATWIPFVYFFVSALTAWQADTCMALDVVWF